MPHMHMASAEHRYRNGDVATARRPKNMNMHVLPVYGGCGPRIDPGGKGTRNQVCHHARHWIRARTLRRLGRWKWLAGGVAQRVGVTRAKLEARGGGSQEAPYNSSRGIAKVHRPQHRRCALGAVVERGKGGELVEEDAWVVPDPVVGGPWGSNTAVVAGRGRGRREKAAVVGLSGLVVWVEAVPQAGELEAGHVRHHDCNGDGDDDLGVGGTDGENQTSRTNVQDLACPKRMERRHCQGAHEQRQDGEWDQSTRMYIHGNGNGGGACRGNEVDERVQRLPQVLVLLNKSRGLQQAPQEGITDASDTAKHGKGCHGCQNIASAAPCHARLWRR
eukprot:m.1052931 g.1052931  ORF g.1052931 m.1052931 type:complete len:333 (+) comp24185_c0_seq51:2356-3354(+)